MESMSRMPIFPPRTQDMKRARRMFKQIDCDNLPQTTQRMVAEAFASPRAMFLGHHGGGGGEEPNSRQGE